MNPGRELDAEIAEKVMGWRLLEFPLERVTRLMPPHKPGQLMNLPPDLPAYSTDIAAAWQVFEAVRYDRAYFEFDNVTGWEVSLRDGEVSRADALPHAICIAALKAVGVAV